MFGLAPHRGPHVLVLVVLLLIRLVELPCGSCLLDTFFRAVLTNLVFLLILQLVSSSAFLSESFRVDCKICLGHICSFSACKGICCAIANHAVLGQFSILLSVSRDRQQHASSWEYYSAYYCWHHMFDRPTVQLAALARLHFTILHASLLPGPRWKLWTPLQQPAWEASARTQRRRSLVMCHGSN